MPEGQTGSREENQEAGSLQIMEVYSGPPPEGDVGQGLLFHTNQGDIPAIFHEAPDSHLGVIWICGARGGFGGPGPGTYVRLAEDIPCSRNSSASRAPTSGWPRSFGSKEYPRCVWTSASPMT